MTNVMLKAALENAHCLRNVPVPMPHGEEDSTLSGRAKAVLLCTIGQNTTARRDALTEAIRRSNAAYDVETKDGQLHGMAERQMDGSVLE